MTNPTPEPRVSDERLGGHLVGVLSGSTQLTDQLAFDLCDARQRIVALESGPRVSVYRLIDTERDHQEAKYGDRWTCASVGPSIADKLSVLAEEFGEVCIAANGEAWGKAGKGSLRDELVDLAAVAVAWLEALSD